MSAIAEERNLKTTTIEGHLASFIGRGKLSISDFLPQDKVDKVTAFFKEKNTVSTAEAKGHFGDEFSYGEVRMVLEHLEFLRAAD